MLAESRLEGAGWLACDTVDRPLPRGKCENRLLRAAIHAGIIRRASRESSQAGRLDCGAETGVDYVD